MELGIALFTLLVLFAFAVYLPGFGLALALGMPLIDTAIGEAGSFLSIVAPGVVLSGALLRLIFVKNKERSQNALSLLDLALIFWLAYLPLSVILSGTSALSGSAEFSMFSAMRLVYMAFLFYFAARIIASTTGIDELVRSFANGMVCVGLVVAIIALVRMESMSEFTFRLTIGRTVIALATFLMMSVISAIFIIFFLKGTATRVERLVAFVALPVLLYAVVLTNTRSAIFGGALVMLYYVFRSITSRYVGIRSTISIFMAVILIVCSFFYFALENPEQVARLMNRVGDMGSEGLGQSDQARVDLLNYAMAMVDNEPLFGNGIGNFEFIHGSYAHNMFIETLVDMGMLGMVFLLFVVLSSSFTAIRYQNLNAIYVGALLLYLVFVSMISMSLWMHKNLFVALGLASSIHLFQLRAKKKRRKRVSQKRRSSHRLNPQSLA